MMQQYLREKIGEGAFADVHAWAPGQVLKLFKAAIPQRVGMHEPRMTRAAFAAGAPAPDVLDEVTMDGRFGLVLSRLDGPTLLHLSRTGPMTPRQVGAILAILALSIHKMRPPPGVLLLRDWMDLTLRRTSDKLPESIATGILPWIERLSPGAGLCHGDLHPGNVIMTADGPRLIDWLGMVRAPPALDLAISHIILSELAPDFADDPNRPRAVNAAMQSEYARLADMSPAPLTASIEPYLPIVCVFALLGPAPTPAQRERLIQRAEAAFRVGPSPRLREGRNDTGDRRFTDGRH